MAELSSNDRAALWSEFMSEVSQNRESVDLVKADLRAAVDAIDSWVDDNQASFNSALPLPARTALTAKQKARLLMFVVRRRWEVT